MKKIKERKYSVLSILSKYSFVLVILFSVMMPFVFIGACGNIGEPACGPSTSTSSDEGPSTSTSGDNKISGTIENPLKGGIDTLPKFVELIINAVLVIGIPILVLAIIYAGFMYVKAQGNPGELEVAHRTLLYTVIGGALLLGAFVIANAIGKTVEEIKSTT